MALFKQSDPESVLAKSIADEHAVRDQLESRLIAAKRTAEESQHAARKAVRALVSDAELDKAEAKEIASERRVTNLTLELADATSKIAALEKQLAVAADQRIRKATALEVEKIAQGFASSAANVVTALAALVKQTERMITFMPDAQGLHIFAQKVGAELPGNVEMLTGLIRSYTDGVLAGGFAATLPQPAPPPAPLPKPAEVVQVCALKAICWLDHAGAVRIAARGEDVGMPPKEAKRGIEINAVCRMDDVRRKAVRQNYTMGGRPLRRHCTELSDNMPLDDEREPLSDRRVVQPIRSSPALPPGFEPHPNLGSPREVSVQGARHAVDLESRNKDEGNKP